VQYLAEVQKQAKSFIGGVKTELKLLAFQRNDQSWAGVPTEESIVAEEANQFNHGVLVLVDLGGNRQVQRPPKEAGKELVAILQNFSRLLDKSKNQEDEIEQWRQSLTYQSQELHRREMEIESQAEQLQQLEQEWEKLEAQRLEVQQELRYLEERQQQMPHFSENGRGSIEPERLAHLQEMLQRLNLGIAPPEILLGQLAAVCQALEMQQATLLQEWLKLEQQRARAEQMQAGVDSEAINLQNRQRDWEQIHISLEKAQLELTIQERTLAIKQESAESTNLSLQNQEEVYQQIYKLVTGSEYIEGVQKVDTIALQNMPLSELEQTVNDLQEDLHRVERFVNDQEEELKMQQEAIDELKSKIDKANEFDRLSFGAELADEEDRYNMLDETLIGQRRSLKERQETLNQHLQVLNRRQGSIAPQNNQSTELEPVLRQMEEHKKQQEQELQRQEGEIAQIRQTIQQTHQFLDQRLSEHLSQQQELQTQQERLRHSQVEVAKLWCQIEIYQQTLQPIQDSCDAVKHKLDEMGQFAERLNRASESQSQTLGQLHQLVSSFADIPEPAMAS
jgi:chromosome segregation ATPase